MTPMWRLSDERLAKLARTGDERALTLLFERHGPGLYRYCRSIVHHDQDAQDVVQTTMLRAIAALRRSELEGALRPWLFRIAHNESITLLRRRRPTDDIEEQSGVTGVPIEARLEDRERLTTLVADLRELPERQRAALIMRELNGLSHAEISAALDIPISATKQAIFEARIEQCLAPRALEDAAFEDWDGRIARVTWAAPRAGWKEAARRLFERPDGVVLDLTVSSRLAAREQRKPWNRGRTRLEPVAGAGEIQRVFARYSGTTCDAYPPGPVRLYYETTTDPQPGPWPADDLPGLLGLVVAEPPPAAYLAGSSSG